MGQQQRRYIAAAQRQSAVTFCASGLVLKSAKPTEPAQERTHLGRRVRTTPDVAVRMTDERQQVVNTLLEAFVAEARATAPTYPVRSVLVQRQLWEFMALMGVSMSFMGTV